MLSHLALEAPLATTAWWALAHRHLGAGWPSGLAPALFLGVWGIYLLDRMHDASSQTHPSCREPLRKVFARKNRCLLTILAGMALGGAALIGICFVSGKIWRQAGVAAALTLAYFALFRRFKVAGNLPYKEAMIAFCFAFAVGIPFRRGDPWVLKTGALVMLTGLCFLNCLIISRAEAAFDRMADPSAWFAGKSNRSRNFPFRFAFAVLAVFLAWLTFRGVPAEVCLPLLLSLGLLALLHAKTFRLGSAASPACVIQPLADAALWLPPIVAILCELLMPGVKR